MRESSHNNKPQTLTREQLHALVWSTPRTKLAKTYGMSDVGFSKLCKRAEVPCPPRGYWTKLSVGLPVEQVALPPATRTSAPLMIKSVAERSPFDKEFWALHKRLRDSLAGVSVPSLIEKPHKALGGQVQALVTDSFTATSLNQRRLRILDTILRHAEAMGFTAKATESQTWLEYGLHRVDLQARQHVKQIRRPLQDRPGRFAIDLRPTGLLSFRMRCPVRLPWKLQFVDEPSSLIESSIVDILASLAMTKALLDQRRDEDEREAALFEAECDVITRREEALMREEEAWQRFLELAERTEKAKSVRSFIDKLEASSNTDAEAAVLAWAKRKLAAFDPLTSVGDRDTDLLAVQG